MEIVHQILCGVGDKLAHVELDGKPNLVAELAFGERLHVIHKPKQAKRKCRRERLEDDASCCVMLGVAIATVVLIWALKLFHRKKSSKARQEVRNTLDVQLKVMKVGRSVGRLAARPTRGAVNVLPSKFGADQRVKPRVFMGRKLPLEESKKQFVKLLGILLHTVRELQRINKRAWIVPALFRELKRCKNTLQSQHHSLVATFFTIRQPRPPIKNGRPKSWVAKPKLEQAVGIACCPQVGKSSGMALIPKRKCGALFEPFLRRFVEHLLAPPFLSQVAKTTRVARAISPAGVWETRAHIETVHAPEMVGRDVSLAAHAWNPAPRVDIKLCAAGHLAR
eukprot:m.9486 g.9486  ORF g.9486 m.9486 type:complete len:337 (-) comp3531_c0_seq1:113-1123(-)